MSINRHIVLKPTLHIVLDRPRIIGNIAAIVRLCVGTQSALHICGPLLFDVSNKTKWRAGLDYFYGARVHFHNSLSRCIKLLNKTPWLLEVGGSNAPWEVELSQGDVVVLGPETASIDDVIMKTYSKKIITIPQVGPVRSLNLAQCAAVVSFEAIRQQTLL